ncbi:MAG: Formyl-coenzyme A transferase [Syntrophaceae bacterium PtaB.Bin038]|nr:MAG: Formyl-coenzyme A transferase [Syntrophaceae bacterium PtaB.Bin038]
MAEPTMKRALEGIRVVDLTTIVMGPYATQILGDFGADVIKVEAPPGGDPMRFVGPSRTKGMGPLFLQLNRNKRSILLDLKKPEGLEAMLRLCSNADVMAYNIRPQAMERLGLGYEQVRRLNPGVIYAGMFGFGRGGPYAAQPAYDDLIQGISGYSATFAQMSGDVPRYFPVNFCDRTTGIYAVGAITTALFHRERTGEGQAIDIPMFETMVQFLLGDNLYGETFIPALGPAGYVRILAPERRPYATKDGYVCAVIYNDKHWETFFTLAGRADEFRSTPRYRTLAGRTQCINELYGLAAEIFRTRTTAEWIGLLTAADIPVAPLHTLETLLRDPHLIATDFYRVLEHPSEGKIRLMRSPTEWSDTPAEIRRLPPRPGEHSEEILGELGYSREEISALFDKRVVQAG